MPYEPPSEAALRWVSEQLDGSVEHYERLLGGITAAMDRIVLQTPAGARTVVLRRWPAGRRHAIDHVRCETAALIAAAEHGIAAPRLIGADPSGERAGRPSVLMTEVPGRVELAPTDLDGWVDRLAGAQARIHAMPATLTDKRDGWFDPGIALEWIQDAGLRREAVTAASGTDPDDEPIFVHGDYQHFNVLWAGGEVSGIVDWPMAGTGPRGIDVGHCRLNLAVLFSADAADRYLDCYQRAAGVTVDPHTDLRALLVWQEEWKEFIPTQVAGRAGIDLPGMAGRVAETVRRAVRRLG
ncbi:MAG: aminoglycoside phosphotransferase family protein [Microlunatus sp.]|nr:aminoglycoside phosphotransferase family protein [Microlunatus sp.]